MDLSKILPVILNLLQSGSQSPPPPQQNQNVAEDLPALDASNACWQLPNYDFPPSNHQQKENISKQQHFTPQTSVTQNNFLANIDINSLISIITEIMKILPKKQEEQKEEKEVSPSYISNLQRTDRFTFD